MLLLIIIRRKVDVSLKKNSTYLYKINTKKSATPFFDLCSVCKLNTLQNVLHSYSVKLSQDILNLHPMLNCSVLINTSGVKRCPFKSMNNFQYYSALT